MKKNPKVSVCMITYNHENYIREAIEGVLIQQCNFDVELIIANDCSTDKTDKKVQNIIHNHPNSSWIQYTNHSQNKGMMPNFIWAMQQCKGKYIALCEGDDYWTDPLKLQKQVDFLEANEEYVLCFHQVNILKTNGEIVDDFITKVPENYETLETLALLGNYIHTPSVVFRNIIKEFPFEFEQSPIGDYFLYMMLSQHGKLKCLHEEMAVYRYGVGIHSTKDKFKMAKSNFLLFSLLLSYFYNPKINQILLERQKSACDNLGYLIRSEYIEAFVSNHVFFKALKSLKQPNKFWKKVKNKFFYKC